MARHERIPYEVIRDWLKERTEVAPKVGIICGSGLGGLSAAVESPQVFQYADIPHFPSTTVAGHRGELIFGHIRGTPVVLMRGRFHCYEGHSPHTTTVGVRTMALLGVETLLVTNAAGGLNQRFHVGDLMIIADHIYFPGIAGNHPLVGPNEELFGDRFPPMSDAYDSTMRHAVMGLMRRKGFTDFARPDGTYAGVSGPSYETGAESRMLHMVGGDAVGMSTVPEVVAARHAGMRVFGLSLITNMVVMPGSNAQVASHQEVLQAVKTREPQIKDLVIDIVELLQDEEKLKATAEEEQSTRRLHDALRNAAAVAAVAGAAGVALALASRFIQRR